MLPNSYIGVENAKPKIIALTKKTAVSVQDWEILKGLKDNGVLQGDGWKKKDSI